MASETAENFSVRYGLMTAGLYDPTILKDAVFIRDEMIRQEARAEVLRETREEAANHFGHDGVNAHLARLLIQKIAARHGLSLEPKYVVEKIKAVPVQNSPHLYVVTCVNMEWNAQEDRWRHVGFGSWVGKTTAEAMAAFLREKKMLPEGV